MFNAKTAFSGFSVNDLQAAKTFYSEKLGLKVEDDGVGARLHLPGGGEVFTYPKQDHQPATFTILNFRVDDIDAAVDDLTRRGVSFERYDNGPKQDAKASCAAGPRIGARTSPGSRIPPVTSCPSSKGRERKHQ